MKYLSMLILLISVLNCQALKNRFTKKIVEERKFSGPQIVKPIKSQSKLMLHKMDDENCRQEDALSDLGVVEVHMFNSETRKIELISIDLSGVSGNPLRSEYVDGLYKGYQEITNYKDCEEISAKGYQYCKTADNEILSLGERINICKKSYPADSIENSAIVSLYGVHSLGKCLQPYIEEQFPINIQIHPLYVNRLKGFEWFDANNAFWTNAAIPVNPKVSTIAMLAHTKGQVGVGSNFDHEFIQNIGIISHEAGHNYVSHLAQSAFSLTEDRPVLGGKTPFEIYHLKQTQQRNIGTKEVFDAFNEGTADLYAYFCHLDNVYSSLRFGYNADIRDPTKDLNPDSSEKILDQDVLRHFFSSKMTRPSGRSPNHKDIHHVGAFWAHGLIKFWDALEYSLDKKIQKTVELNRALDDVSRKDKDPLQYMNELFYASIKGSLNYDLDDGQAWLSDKNCDILNKYFPVNFINIQSKLECR